jgi:short-subunit dehydrogenase
MSESVAGSTDKTPQGPPVALITGASSGIGRALARQFVEHGYDVVIAAEDPELADAAAELRASGREVVPVQVDLSTPEGVTELYLAATEGGRPVEAVALNAGIGVGGSFSETDLEADLRLVDLNVRSTVHLAKLVVRDMVARGDGKLLFTASIAAKAPGPFHATYAASKAFVHSLAEALRVELGDTGVTVTSLMPGPTDTEFFDRADMEDTRIGQGSKDDPDDVAADGFKAMLEGRDHVVAGSVKNKVMAGMSTVSPDKAAAASMAKMTEPGSGT